MNTRRVGCVVVLLLLFGIPALADADPAAQAAEARKLQERADYGAALAIWQALIADHRKHPIVADGDAHQGAAFCLGKQEEHAEVAKIYEHRLHQFDDALEWTQAALDRAAPDSGAEAALSHRAARLRRRLGTN